MEMEEIMKHINESEIVAGLSAEWGGINSVPETVYVGRTYTNRTFDLSWLSDRFAPIPEGQGRPFSELIRSSDGKVLWNHD
jgi:hypothetical protein